jgi:putative transposase
MVVYYSQQWEDGMTYSVDLRKRVVAFVREGGSKSEAARIFGVARSCVYDWLSRDNLKPKKHGRRKRKLDWAALERHIEEYPDLLLRERAAHFGVRMYSIQYACRQMRISHKKNSALRRKRS